MALVTDASPRTQQTYGKFKPRANLDKFSVVWAVVDGDGGGYPTVDEVTNVGIPIGSTGRAFLKYEEYVGPGKPGAKPNTHDIKVGSRTLREMICPKEEADQKTAMEAMESTENCRNFLEASDIKNRVDASGLVSLRTEVSEKLETIQSNQQ